MRFNFSKILFFLVPLILAAVYFKFICTASLPTYEMPDGFTLSSASDVLGCFANSVVFILLFWGFTGVLVAVLKLFWKKGRDLLGRVFFGLPLSIIFIVIALLLRGIFSLTCGCIHE